MPTEEQKKNRQIALQNIKSGIDQNIGITPPSAISADSLGQTVEPLELPPNPLEDGFDFASIPITEILDQANEPTQTEKQQSDLQTRLLELVDQEGGRGEAQLRAENQFGVPEFQRQLNEFNNQIKSLEAEFNAVPLQIQQEFEGRGATAGGVKPIQSSRQRNIAIKALGVSALAQAAQGNLALAQQQADRAVELEFAPIERNLNFIREALAINESRLNREDKKRAQVVNFLIDERTRQINDQKAEKKNIRDIMTLAAQSGAPANVLADIYNARSVEQAMGIASFAISDEQRRAIEERAAQQEFENRLAYAKQALSEERYEFEKKLALKELGLKQEGLRLQELKIAKDAQKEQDEITALKQKDFKDVSERVRANTELRDLVTEYRDIIERTGFSGDVFGAKTLGKLKSLRAQITTSVKKAETLGTLDQGVLQLVSELIGQSPEKKFFGLNNIFGLKSGGVVSGLDTFLTTIGERIKIDETVVDTGSFLPNLFTAEELQELDFSSPLSANVETSTAASFYDGI